MKYYLLSKEEFSSLYKHGSIHIKKGVVESESPSEAAAQLLAQADSFEYAQEMLILSSDEEKLDSLEMFNVIKIFPLDTISKGVFESQFGSSIIFQEPVFQNLVDDFIHNTVLARETINGIKALRTIFQLGDEEDVSLVDEIIKGKTFLYKWRKYYDVPLNQRSPISMLIAYNRYRHYPKDIRGYFYDVPDCFMYATLTDYPDFLGFDRDIVYNNSHSYQEFLNAVPSEVKFGKLASMVEESGEKICEAIAKVFGSVHFVALYFYMKDRILADETLSISSIRFLCAVKSKYPEDFSKLVTLIGGYFGYSWFNDRLYEFTKRPFISLHHDITEFEKAAIPIQHDTKESQAGLHHIEINHIGPEPKEGIPSSSIIDGELDDSTASTDNSSVTYDVSGVDESVGIPETHSSTNGGAPATRLNIDLIARELFPRNSDRKKLFIAMLSNNCDKILGLISASDEDGLRALYPKLDKRFKKNKTNEAEKPSIFARACLMNQANAVLFD